MTYPDYVTLFETGQMPPAPDVIEEPSGEILRPEGAPLAPVEVPTGNSLLEFLGWPTNDEEQTAFATRHVSHVLALLHTHTRGRGFSLGAEPPSIAADLAQVVLSAAARSLVNPSQAKRVEVGDVVQSPTPFAAFTLAELGVINRYRVRVA